MASLFLMGGAIVVASQLVIMGANQTAAQGYCDCGYLKEELIAQAKALDLGYAIQAWLATGGLVIVGLAAASAGWAVDIGPAWRLLSYAIAVALVVGGLLLIPGQGVLSDVVSGVAGAILVPIWAFVLVRALPLLEAHKASPETTQ